MKKHSIKLIALLLGTLMILGTLSGCGAAGDMNFAPMEPGSSYYPPENVGGEEYAEITESPFLSVAENPFSTFSADVDTASYTNIRRMINAGYRLRDIPKNAVRTEEFLNYFDYDYELPKEGEPFGVSVSISACPWNSENMLAIFGFRTEEISYEDNDKPSNLVFLIDVSGSMNDSAKLPLLKEAFGALTESLGEGDKVSIVTYSGKEAVVLDGCAGNKDDKILSAINKLKASGSTNGQAGLEKAYALAKKHFIQGGNNRIIMASDGDLNVGINSAEELKNYVSEMRDSGVYLSVLGFGSGNYKDSKMEALADNGNGNYFYIDCLEEAERVLRDDLNATINTVADDVKFRVDFNGEYVKEYRLIGYENRILNTEDFEDDTKDAGEVGSGHCLTVAYEIVPAETPEEPKFDEWMTVSINYKEPGDSESKTLEYPISVTAVTSEPDDDWYFAAAVIEFAMVLRNSNYKGESDLDSVIEILSGITLNDKFKEEFKSLVQKLSETAEDSSSDPDSKYQ